MMVVSTRGWGLGIGIVMMACPIACGLALERASMEIVREAEVRWEEAPILDYRITVDVDRPSERRRNEITVRRGRIIEATVAYWDPGESRWDRPAALRDDQASPFTARGLLWMVRDELTKGQRSDIQIAMDETLLFPKKIVMGPARLNERTVPHSEAAITVHSFEVTAPEGPPSPAGSAG